MLDICRVFLTMDLDRCPKFVVGSLAKLNPITTNGFGLGRVLTELDYLKITLKKIEDRSDNQHAAPATQQIRTCSSVKESACQTNNYECIQTSCHGEDMMHENLEEVKTR